MRILRILLVVLAFLGGIAIALWVGDYWPGIEDRFTSETESVDETTTVTPPTPETEPPPAPLPPSIPDVESLEQPDDRPVPGDTADIEPPQRLPSGLIIPVAGIQPENLIDTFADARSANRSHDAIDIIAPRRTPVLAAADGTIVRLFNSENGGITLYQLAPDNRTVYYYAHLDGYADGVRDSVFAKQGAVIGYVGDTGNAVPGNYHLHFAIWITDDPKNFWDGESINPYPLLRGE
jgi:murein DD-endopeptidase MepM/ murein hydrolase activator NlpD